MSKIRLAFHRDRVAGDLREEMDVHFELELRERIAAGESEEEARANARRRFGNPAWIQDRAMDTWTFNFWDTLLQDIRYAVRTLWRTPAFTIVALLSLAVGIGAGTAIFSLMNALLWKNLPVPAPERLVLVWPHDGSGPRANFSFYHTMFKDFRQRSTVFSGVSASWLIDLSNLVLDGNGAPAGPARIGLVSGDYFSTLGVQPALGRAFTMSDERQDNASVAVIGYGFWQAKFNADPNVVGRTLRMNQTIFTIVGVAARDFHGDWPGHPADLWFPFTMTAAALPAVPQGARHPTRAFARLQPGITAPQAQAASQALYQQLLTDATPKPSPQIAQEIARQTIELQPAGGGYVPQRETLATPVAVLTVLAVLMLLAGWANVANLWLARSVTRQREMAVRAAIGAGGSRIVRQMLTETVLLAVCGGLLGVLFSSITTGSLVSMLGSAPANIRSDSAAASLAAAGLDLYHDARVFGFTALVCLVAGIGFGVGPALRFGNISLAPALADRGGDAGRRGGVRKALVVVQVSLSMVLLCGAALFVQTLDNLKRQDLGFQRDHLLIASVDAAQTGRAIPALVVLSETVRQQMLSIPGVIAASMGPLLTGLMGGGGSESFHMDGMPPKPGLVTARSGVMPGFFAAVGTPLLSGREFTDRDTASAPRVAIMNQTLARFFFGDENPVGKRMWLGNESNAAACEIIGVVKDQKSAPRDQRGIWYVPYAQATNQLRGTWYVAIRTTGDPRRIANAVRQRLKAIDPALPVFSIATVDEHLDATVSQERLLTILSLSFAAIATILACIGLYGMMAYTTARRTREFGIRIALGATAGGVRGMVLKDALLLALVGIVTGVPLTIAGARGASAILFRVSIADQRIFLAAAAILATVAVTAGLVPAVRASRIHPSDALRHD